MKNESDSKTWKKDVKVLTETYDKILSELSPGLYQQAARKATNLQAGSEKERLVNKFEHGRDASLDRGRGPGSGTSRIVALKFKSTGAVANVQVMGPIGDNRLPTGISALSVITKNGKGRLVLDTSKSEMILHNDVGDKQLAFPVEVADIGGANLLSFQFQVPRRSIPMAAQVHRDAGNASPAPAPETAPGQAPGATEQPGLKGPQGAV